MAILVAISDRSCCGRLMDQLCFFSYCQKRPILGPKLAQNGPKQPKLHFCHHISYVSMQGVIFTYFSVLSSSVVFIFVDFTCKVTFFCPAMGSVRYSHQNRHLSPLWGYNPIKVTFSLWRTPIFGLFRLHTARGRYQNLIPRLISYTPKPCQRATVHSTHFWYH